MRALSTDGLRNFRFLVGIVPLPNMSPTIGKLGFMTASGFGIQNEVIPYREGGDNSTAIPLTSNVLTVNGWKPMADIEIGDRVIDPKGEESKVIDILPAGVKDTYRITLGDGSIAYACHGHLWEFQVRDTNNQKKIRIDSTLAMKHEVERKGYQILLPKLTPAEFDVSPELPVDPYLLGLLLSEGYLGLEGVSFAQEEANTEIIERARESLPEGHFLIPKYQDGVLKSWGISVGNKGPGARNVNGRNKVLQAVRELGLLGHRAWEKFIPEIYKYASVADRLALLQGIMDGDGWVDIHHCTAFSSSSPQLASDTRDLVYSLGGRCGPIRHKTDRSYRYKGVMRPARDKYEFSGISDLEMVPFTLPRKVERFLCSPKTSSQFRRVRSVEFIGQEVVQCIEVSASSHLFISDDFVPSHNTRKVPGQTDFGPITLSRGSMAAPQGPNGVGVNAGTNETWNWLQAIFSVMEGQGTSKPGDDFRTDLYIDVLEHPVTSGPSAAGINTTPAIKLRVHVYNAWPMGWNLGDLDAGGEGMLLESLQLAHEGFRCIYATNTAGDFVSSSAQ